MYTGSGCGLEGAHSCAGVCGQIDRDKSEPQDKSLGQQRWGGVTSYHRLNFPIP